MPPHSAPTFHMNFSKSAPVGLQIISETEIDRIFEWHLRWSNFVGIPDFTPVRPASFETYLETRVDVGGLAAEDPRAYFLDERRGIQ